MFKPVKKNSVRKYGMGMPNAWSSAKIFSTLVTEVPADFETITIYHFNAAFFEFACNPRYFQGISNLGLVKPEVLAKAEKIYNTNQNFTNDEKIEVLFGVRFDFAYTVLNYFWRPNQNLQTTVDTFVKSEFEGYFVIGLQFRFGYLEKSETETNDFMQCAIDAETEITKSKINMNKTVKWFLTGEYEQYFDHVRKKYPQKVKNQYNLRIN